ncbi:MAG: class I SAM-dependent DNA methyltransferase [Anaerolineales bacterium]
MNAGPFGEGYAPQYDRLYSDKDYVAECALIEEVFQRYGRKPIRSILDLGCGTGGHAFPLAARGYRVTGVDVSPAMLREAERKLAKQTQDSVPEFVLGDIRELELDRRFDAALMMFAVLGYQASDADLQLALQSVRRHLRPGGLFVGDLWYGPTVLRVAPSDRIKQVDFDGQQLVRSATTTLDLGRHQAAVHYRLARTEPDGATGIDEETHTMRFFFPMELERAFRAASFELVGLHPFPQLADPLNSTVWNALFCGRAD